MTHDEASHGPQLGSGVFGQDVVGDGNVVVPGFSPGDLNSDWIAIDRVVVDFRVGPLVSDVPVIHATQFDARLVIGEGAGRGIFDEDIVSHLASVPTVHAVVGRDERNAI